MSTPDRTEQFAALINSGLRPLDARTRMGLTKGQTASIMRSAKTRGLVANVDHSWLREVQMKSAALVRDEIADMASDGITLEEIGVTLGMTINMVRKHWLVIRRGLGWQAV